jgi:hypothetical protein
LASFCQKPGLQQTSIPASGTGKNESAVIVLSIVASPDRINAMGKKILHSKIKIFPFTESIPENGFSKNL